MTELTKKHADAAFKLIQTLRRFNLAPIPDGRYSDTGQVFDIWSFAKRHGVLPKVD